MPKLTGYILLICATFCLGACGFQPLYATTQGDNGASGLQNVDLLRLTASTEIEPFVRKAFARRAGADPSGAEYELIVNAKERAERLAVQIDASVTRYNYRLIGDYVLVHRKTGERISGRGEAIASFNVVSSQYSTLFAEKAAREKAATSLVAEIERDLLLKIAAQSEAKDQPQK